MKNKTSKKAYFRVLDNIWGYAFVLIPIIGLVENMSYFKCPDCGKEHKIFGDSHIEEIAAKHNLKVLAKLPIDPKISAACDKGMMELFDGEPLAPVAKILVEGIEGEN